MIVQILGPLVGFIGVAFAVYAYIKNRKPKRLEYEVHTNQRILPQSKYTNRWSNLSVRFENGEGRTLQNARIIVIRVENSGKVEAREDDFVEPFSVKCASGGEIVAAKIVINPRDGDPREVEPTRLDESGVACPKLLLNEKDWLEIILLVDGKADSVNLSGRAAGFEIVPYGERKSWAKVAILTGVPVGLTVGAILGVLAFNTLLHSFLPVGQVQVPSVIGKPIDQAAVELNNVGLRVGGVTRIPHKGKSDIVMSTLPTAGRNVDRDTRVSLVVSSQP